MNFDSPNIESPKVSIPTSLEQIYTEWRRMERKIETHQLNLMKSETQISNLKKENEKLNDQLLFYKTRIEMLEKALVNQKNRFDSFEAKKDHKHIKNPYQTSLVKKLNNSPNNSNHLKNRNNEKELLLESDIDESYVINQKVHSDNTTNNKTENTVKASWKHRSDFGFHLDKVNSINLFKASDKSTCFVSGGEDGLVVLWKYSYHNHKNEIYGKNSRYSDNNTYASFPEIKNVWRGHMAGITSVVVNESSNMVYSSGMDNLICIYDASIPFGVSSEHVNNNFPVFKLEGHMDIIWDLDIFAPKKTHLSSAKDPGDTLDSILVSSSADGTCKLWDIGSKQPQVLGEIRNPLKSKAGSSTSRFIESTSGLGLSASFGTDLIHLFDVSHSLPLVSTLQTKSRLPVTKFAGLNPNQGTRKNSFYSNLLYTGSEDGTICMFDTRCKHFVGFTSLCSTGCLDDHKKDLISVTSLDFNGELLACGDSLGNVSIYDPRFIAQRHSYFGYSGAKSGFFFGKESTIPYVSSLKLGLDEAGDRNSRTVETNYSGKLSEKGFENQRTNDKYSILVGYSDSTVSQYTML
ncbi:hypothetical protein BB558_005130 [Smittium angustum]|uniref:Striatin N-terminal domain-containing protein n=1 Tax=Smittium angustum TaxID=133377 RepID=A0A2U1J1B6_SMIAN|nr:hypothetical protein BB558_005130 [Smittium angustum]